MVFWRRAHREYRPPPPPPIETVEAIREAERTAELQLREAHSRDEEIDKRTARLERIKQDNALGPRFWRAVGGPS